MSQTILVTGANSGFGRLTVETLARQNHTVFAGIRESTGKNRQATEELQSLAEKEQLALHVVELDVTDDNSAEQAIAHIIATVGHLDVVVNNAGVSYVGPIEACTLEQVQLLFNTNVFGAMRLNRTALPQMRAQGSGLLIQIGSVTGRVGVPFLGLYGATKFALEGLTESCRYELAPFGIDAAIIEPGVFPTTNIATNRQTPAAPERFAPYATTMSSVLPRILDVADTSPDPQDVADAIAALIALPSGERPLHTVVTSMPNLHEAVQTLNDTAENVTRTYFEQLNILPAVTVRHK